MKIFLTAGHNRKDPGAVYAGRKEAEETIKLRNAITAKLREKNIEVWNDRDEWDLNQTIAEIRKLSKPEDIICDLHFNAGTTSATGVEVLIPEPANATEKALAAGLSVFIASTLMIKNRGVKPETASQHKRLGMMRPDGLNVLIEVCFISSKYDMQQYDTNFGFLAEGVADVLVKFVIKNPAFVA